MQISPDWELNSIFRDPRSLGFSVIMQNVPKVQPRGENTYFLFHKLPKNYWRCLRTSATKWNVPNCLIVPMPFELSIYNENKFG